MTGVAEPDKITTYEYDAVGNRKRSVEELIVDSSGADVVEYTKKETSYTYSASNELTGLVEQRYSGTTFVGGTAVQYSYDPNGNQYMTLSAKLSEETAEAELGLVVGAAVGVEMTQAQFDVFGRMTSMTKTKDLETVTATYTYNGDGLRQSRAVTSESDTKTTNYLYDGSYVVQESGSATATYVRGMNYIAKIGASNSVSYYQYNAHGDVVGTTDSVGAAQNRYDYSAFGEEKETEETAENSLRYGGEFYDAELELYYQRARYYEPSTGRFLSEDTYTGAADNPATFNLYAFCNGDPVNYIDPNGHATKPPAWMDWNDDSIIDTQRDRNYFDKNNDYIADWNQGIGSKADYRLGGSMWHTQVTNSSEIAVTNYAYLSKQKQQNIDSVIRAQKGNFVSIEEMIENIKLNGGTVAKVTPTPVQNDTSFDLVGNVENLTPEQRTNIKSAVHAYNNGIISFQDMIVNISQNGAIVTTSSRKIGIVEGYESEEGEDKAYIDYEPISYEDDVASNLVYVRLRDQEKTGILINDVTYLQLREIVEGLGGTIDWDAKTDIATGIIGENTIEFDIPNKILKFNGVERKDVRMFFDEVENRIKISVRDIAELTGLDPRQIIYYSDSSHHTVVMIDAYGLFASTDDSRKWLLKLAQESTGNNNLSLTPSGFLHYEESTQPLYSATADSIVYMAAIGAGTQGNLIEFEAAETLYHIAGALPTLATGGMAFPSDKFGGYMAFGLNPNSFDENGMIELKVKNPESGLYEEQEKMSIETNFIHELTHVIQANLGITRGTNNRVFGRSYNSKLSEAWAIMVQNQVIYELNQTKYINNPLGYRYDGSTLVMIPESEVYGNGWYGEFDFIGVPENYEYTNIPESKDLAIFIRNGFKPID